MQLFEDFALSVSDHGPLFRPGGTPAASVAYGGDGGGGGLAGSVYRRINSVNAAMIGSGNSVTGAHTAPNPALKSSFSFFGMATDGTGDGGGTGSRRGRTPRNSAPNSVSRFSSSSDSGGDDDDDDSSMSDLSDGYGGGKANSIDGSVDLDEPRGGDGDGQRDGGGGGGTVVGAGGGDDDGGIASAAASAARSGVLSSLASIFGITSCAPSLNVNSAMSLHTRTNLLMHMNWVLADAALLALRRQLVATVCHSMAAAVQYRDVTYLDYSFLWSHHRQAYLTEFLGVGYVLIATRAPQDVQPGLFPASQRLSTEDGSSVKVWGSPVPPSRARSMEGWTPAQRAHLSAKLHLVPVGQDDDFGGGGGGGGDTAAVAGAGAKAAAAGGVDPVTGLHVFNSNIVAAMEVMVRVPVLKVRAGHTGVPQRRPNT